MLNKFAQHFFKTCHIHHVYLLPKQDFNLFCRLSSSVTSSHVQESSDQFFPSNKREDTKADDISEPESHTKLLRVSIIGSPNVGKSTLINKFMNRRVVAISSKIHTTKCRARAVLNEGDTQLVFLDTPGLVSVTELKKYKLEQSFILDGENSLQEADIVGVLHDVSVPNFREKLDPKVLRLLHFYPKKHYILILNKIDAMKSKRKLLDLVNILTKKKLGDGSEGDEEFQPMSEVKFKRKVKEEKGWPHFREVFMISALTGSGVDDLREYLVYHAKPRKWMFPEDVFTDQNPASIIMESVRSRLLDHLPKEVPYSLDVQMEYFDTTPEGTIIAVVLVVCDKERIEKLVMGAGGGRIKIIARQAEQELANTFLTVVKVKLVVKSKESKDSDTINV